MLKTPQAGQINISETNAALARVPGMAALFGCAKDGSSVEPDTRQSSRDFRVEETNRFVSGILGEGVVPLSEEDDVDSLKAIIAESTGKRVSVSASDRGDFQVAACDGILKTDRAGNGLVDAGRAVVKLGEARAKDLQTEETAKGTAYEWMSGELSFKMVIHK